MAPLALAVAVLAACCIGPTCAALTVSAALTDAGLHNAGAIDAHGSIAYIAGEAGVTAVDVTAGAVPVCS
jgi:hypothetical protein